ncbi:MAG TPA: hypothetical protein VL551_06675 [Actinospica sp.]|jgi:hypothetical protein|nr:hypothetical protein [Actinospica sp.]
MSGFTPGRDGGPTVVNATPGFSVKARKTKKARHKDDQARITAHARSVGRTGKARERERGYDEVEELVLDERRQVPVVPRRDNGGPNEAREHVRRDIGSHVAVFELGAADNPADLTGPFQDPQGAEMRWAVRCLTHEETRFLGDHRAAIQAVKASHTWCAGCAEAVAGSRRVRHRARTRLKEATS